MITVSGVTLNTGTAPFEVVDARRAVAYALDRSELAQLFARSINARFEAQVTCQVIPPNVPGYAPHCPYTSRGADIASSWGGPDLTRARDLVRRSGTLGAEVVVAMSEPMEPIADHVASTLTDLGYRVQVQIVRVPSGFIVVTPDLMPPEADVSFSVGCRTTPLRPTSSARCWGAVRPQT